MVKLQAVQEFDARGRLTKETPQPLSGETEGNTIYEFSYEFLSSVPAFWLASGEVADQVGTQRRVIEKAQPAQGSTEIRKTQQLFD
ncbi:MAG: hypothetical protein AB1813_22855, partial [Verrucomicrobiota bacterium]